MFEREHLFNPFQLMDDNDENLSKTINDLAKQYRYSDLPQDIVFNINLEADLLMIYGEFIARLTEKCSLLKLENDVKEDKLITQLRTDWLKENTDKAPAMRYFEAKASEVLKDDRAKQFKEESMLKRFKQAYASLETKQNALKKKLESLRYEC